MYPFNLRLCTSMYGLGYLFIALKISTGAPTNTLGSHVLNLSTERSQNDAFAFKSASVDSKVHDGIHREYWVQIGRPRTATTLQFEILCAAQFLRLRTNTTALRDMTCQYLFPKERGIPNYSSSREHAVVKTHHWRSEWNDEAPGSMLIFGTRARGTSIVELPNGHVYALVMDTAKVTKWGSHSVYAYQEILALTDDDMVLLNKFIECWDILRLCCGAQMSESWRMLLDPTQKRHEGGHFTSDATGAGHRCAMYNISAVEAMFSETDLFREMAKYKQLAPMLRPSTIDNNLDGTYCERYNTEVRTHHLKHMRPLQP